MSKVHNHKIKERIYYAVHIKMLSPLSISNGESELTDADVLVDEKGDPFIPGTSLAGAFRNNLEFDKKTDCVMGYSNEEEGRMSRLFIQDIYLEHAKRSSRDGVRLGEDKTVIDGGKYDREIVETGASGWLFMELLLREGIDETGMGDQEAVRTVLYHLHNGDIRIGAKKNRGMGRVEISEIYEKHFQDENVDAWLEFMEDPNRIEHYRKEDQIVTFEQWREGKKFGEDRFLKITVPLELEGGISIRKYSAEPGKADYEHITCNGDPVIPGNSWNGAIRSRMREFLSMLQIPAGNDYLDEWFGYVDVKKKDDTNEGYVREKASQSKVVIGESILKGSRKVPMTRTKINRFSAAASDGALYQELSYFGGKTELEIMVDNRMKDREAFLALLGFVLKDIEKGYLAVGGQTAVGRGLFRADGEIVYSGKKPDLELCSKALGELVRGGTK